MTYYLTRIAWLEGSYLQVVTTINVKCQKWISKLHDPSSGRATRLVGQQCPLGVSSNKSGVLALILAKKNQRNTMDKRVPDVNNLCQHWRLKVEVQKHELENRRMTPRIKNKHEKNYLHKGGTMWSSRLFSCLYGQVRCKLQWNRYSYQKIWHDGYTRQILWGKSLIMAIPIQAQCELEHVYLKGRLLVQ